MNDERYARLFEPGRGKVTGEITPRYSVLDENMIRYVHSLMPDAKIIFIMRNPIERSWSAAVMYFDKRGTRKADSVPEKAFCRLIDNAPNMYQRADYPGILENWQKFYPEEQIFVGFIEDIHFHPADMLYRLYEFLGVDPHAKYSVIEQKIHSRSPGQMPVNLASHLARTYWVSIQRLSERFGGYASFWLYCAERLIGESPREGFVPYPLWESSIWREWVDEVGRSSVAGRSRPEPQSGPLSSIQNANWS